MSDALKPCPYCLSDIPSQALVCRHCSRDVSLFQKLLADIEALRVENRSLQASLEAAEKIQNEPVLPAKQPPAPSESPPLPSTTRPLWVAAFWSVLLLGLLHWILFFLYDTPVLVFRLVTIVVPVLLGFWAAGRGRCFWLYQWGIALLASGASVLLMLSITHHIDAVPLWPQNLREWRETLEYLLSIALAMVTGVLVRQAAECWRQNQRTQARWFILQRDDQGRLRLEQLTAEVQNLVTALAPIFSGVMAVYAALKSFLMPS